MTHEEFAHMCLSIKKGNVDIPIPCCANCEHYIQHSISQWFCYHPTRSMNYWDNVLRMQPEDFCSRFEARKD